MSTTNYTVCPRCTKTEKDLADQYRQKVKDSYGKVSESVYLEMRFQEHTTINTLRENCEIYMDENGEFAIYYGCSCGKCGFAFEYNYTEQVLR